jgi:hypothetical protein
MFVARMIPSIVDWPGAVAVVEQCFVFASLTAITGKPSAPSRSSASGG